jgi:hypothetical protein
MTQNEIINMAEFCFEKSKNQIEFIELFAKLVAQHEREACAKVAEDMSKTEANMNKTWRNGCHDVANEIRARGQA